MNKAQAMGAERQVDTVVSHLRQRWDQLFRLTTVEQAMAALGLPQNDDLRLAVGDRLRAQPDAHPAVERWGAIAFILTEPEKLLARCLAQHGTDPASRIAIAAIARVIHRGEAEIERGLAVLRHVELLDWSRSGDSIVYTLTPDWQQRSGPLEFTYHTVKLAGGERFNVP